MVDLAPYWYRRSVPALLWLLLPFSWLFRLIVALRRYCYRRGLLKTQRFPVPVIIVGNVTVGGTGKTPFVIWLAEQLSAQGFKPGIVSRGVGGKAQQQPHKVTLEDSPHLIGDEALLMARRANCPVVICVDRCAAVEVLLAHQCNIIISDDGLQHYRLARDVEIAIVDGERRFGNGQLLPAGPLREPMSRLNEVNFMVVNGGDQRDRYTMSLLSDQLVSLANPEQETTLNKFDAVHAVAGIGHPQRFFKQLQRAGLQVITHPFPDHYLYRSADLNFGDVLPIVMTEKDAVKCESFADERFWWLRVKTVVTAELIDKILVLLKTGEKNDSEADFSMRTCDLVKRKQHDGVGGRTASQ